MRHALLCFALLFTGALRLEADAIVLANGSRFEGIVRESADRVEVETDLGRIEFPRGQVREIERSRGALEEYRTREAALAPEDVAGRFELARWATARDLESSARQQLERVVALDPDHEGARRLLGFEQMNGQWLTHDEAMRARGFVRENGEWITTEELESRSRAAEAARDRAERAAGEARTAELEAALEMRLAALELESAVARAGQIQPAYVAAPVYVASYPVAPRVRFPARRCRASNEWRARAALSGVGFSASLSVGRSASSGWSSPPVDPFPGSWWQVPPLVPVR